MPETGAEVSLIAPRTCILTDVCSWGKLWSFWDRIAASASEEGTDWCTIITRKGGHTTCSRQKPPGFVMQQPLGFCTAPRLIPPVCTNNPAPTWTSGSAESRLACRPLFFFLCIVLVVIQQHNHSPHWLKWSLLLAPSRPKTDPSFEQLQNHHVNSLPTA